MYSLTHTRKHAHHINIPVLTYTHTHTHTQAHRPPSTHSTTAAADDGLTETICLYNAQPRTWIIKACRYILCTVILVGLGTLGDTAGSYLLCFSRLQNRTNYVCSCSHSELGFHNCLPKVIIQTSRVVLSSLNTLFIGMLFSFILLEKCSLFIYFLLLLFFLFFSSFFFSFFFFFFFSPFFSATFCVFIPSEYRFDVMFVLCCKSACSVRGWVWVGETMSSHENKSVSLYILLSNNNLLLLIPC